MVFQRDLKILPLHLLQCYKLIKNLNQVLVFFHNVTYKKAEAYSEPYKISKMEKIINK